MKKPIEPIPLGTTFKLWGDHKTVISQHEASTLLGESGTPGTELVKTALGCNYEFLTFARGQAGHVSFGSAECYLEEGEDFKFPKPKPKRLRPLCRLGK